MLPNIGKASYIPGLSRLTNLLCGKGISTSESLLPSNKTEMNKMASDSVTAEIISDRGDGNCLSVFLLSPGLILPNGR